MKKDSISHALSFILCAAFICITLPQVIVAQSSSQKSSKQESFGSSLRQGTTDSSGETVDESNHKAKDDAAATKVEDTIRVETLLAVFDVSVTDASGSRFISGLRKEDFLVTEDTQPQQVATLTLGDDAARLPRSIVLILDRSDSQLPYLDASIEAAKKLVGQLAPTDEMAIVTDDVQLAVDFTKDKKKLKATLDSLKKLSMNGFHSRSKQFSALLATLRELIDVEKKRPIIIFQTDGDEAERLGGFENIPNMKPVPKAYDIRDVYLESEKSRVKIYTVIPSDRLIGIPPEEVAGRISLMREKSYRAREKHPDMWEGHRRYPPKEESPAKSSAQSNTRAINMPKIMEYVSNMLVQGQTAAARVAELTGGWTSFLEKPEQADDIYGRILADINHRYIIGYYPTNKEHDGRLRKVHIEVRNHPEYVVRGRESYYVGMN
ncbi:MAG: VWA domain-containing protein [Pyrinomonadaceae bacterium]